jgi:hypothetical protein
VRRSIAVLLCVLCIGTPSLPAAGQIQQRPTPGPTTGGSNRDRDGVVLVNPGGNLQGTPTSTRDSSLQDETVLWQRVIVNVLTETCWYWTRTDYPGGIPPAVQAAADLQSAQALAFNQCLNSPPGPPPPTPGEIAEPFVRNIPLPVPNPEIDPGYNITGLLAYLETKSTTSHAVNGTTVLGPISVTARGAYYVNWGDGTPEQGPFTFEGEPYPRGRITHLYENEGLYNVTVREAWTADWNLGGDSGTVTGLQTAATIPLEVRELQAVRQR